MPRECKLYIQIESGPIVDIQSALGFHLVDSDDTVVAPIKDYEVQKYPESAAVEIYPYTTLDPFDYSCTLMAVGPQSTVNASVRAFFDSMFEISGVSDIRKAKPITIYNEWKGVKATGYVKTSPAKGSYPNLVAYEQGAYLFEFIIFVSDPRLLLPWNKT